MLQKVFWNYFKNTGNIDAYLATKDYEQNNDNENNYTRDNYSDYYYKNEKDSYLKQ